LPPRFPCVYDVSCCRLTPSSKLLERPWETSNLSPEPVPKRICRGPPCLLPGQVSQCLFRTMLRLFVDRTRDGSRRSDVDERPRDNIRRSEFPKVHHGQSLSFWRHPSHGRDVARSRVCLVPNSILPANRPDQWRERSFGTPQGALEGVEALPHAAAQPARARDPRKSGPRVGRLAQGLRAHRGPRSPPTRSAERLLERPGPRRLQRSLPPFPDATRTAGCGPACPVVWEGPG
jgi:hypothetical protein